MKKLIDKFLIYLDDCLTSSISEQLVDIMKVMDTESIERSEILKMRNQVRKKIILDELNISSEEALELIGNISAFREIYDYYTNLRYFIIATKKLYKLPNELESSDLLYDTFDVLSTLIYNSHFTAREKMELLFIAIKKVYDDPINKEFLENVVHISDNLAKTDPSLESINKTQTFMSDLDIINERYFMKKNSYEENDIKIIIETLQKLEIETNLCSIIETLLIKELKKRN